MVAGMSGSGWFPLLWVAGPAPELPRSDEDSMLLMDRVGTSAKMGWENRRKKVVEKSDLGKKMRGNRGRKSPQEHDEILSVGAQVSMSLPANPQL